MIDIHCHILPNIDDGAPTMETSLEMARLAISEGITDVIVTPHGRHPQFDNAHIDVSKRMGQVQTEMDEQGIPLTLHLGQEIRLFGELVESLQQGTVFSLAQSRYVLIEFPSQTIPTYAEHVFFELLLDGYIPVIAHPERNRVFVLEPERLYRFIEAGALSQVTTGSLTGRFGKGPRDLAVTFLRHGLSQIVASDAHHPKSRPFDWSEAKQEVMTQVGETTWSQHEQIVRHILRDETFRRSQPTIPKKDWRGKWK